MALTRLSKKPPSHTMQVKMYRANLAMQKAEREYAGAQRFAQRGDGKHPLQKATLITSKAKLDVTRDDLQGMMGRYKKFMTPISARPKPKQKTTKPLNKKVSSESWGGLLRNATGATSRPKKQKAASKKRTKAGAGWF